MIEERMMFSFECASKTFPLKANFAESLFQWGRKLFYDGKVDGAASSLSYRYGLGFVVTVQGANLAELTASDLAWVERWNFDENRFWFRGDREPSRQSFLHALAYQDRSAVIFSFLANWKWEGRSRFFELPGTVHGFSAKPSELRAEAEGFLGRGNLLRISNESLWSLGCTAEDAGVPLADMLGGITG